MLSVPHATWSWWMIRCLLESPWLPVGFRFPSVNSVFYHPREKLDLVPILTLSHASGCYIPITPDKLTWACYFYLFTYLFVYMDWCSITNSESLRECYLEIWLYKDCLSELRLGMFVPYHTLQLKLLCNFIEKHRFNKLIVCESAASQPLQREMLCPDYSQYVLVVKNQAVLIIGYWLVWIPYRADLDSLVDH